MEAFVICICPDFRNYNPSKWDVEKLKQAINQSTIDHLKEFILSDPDRLGEDLIYDLEEYDFESIKRRAKKIIEHINSFGCYLKYHHDGDALSESDYAVLLVASVVEEVGFKFEIEWL